MVKLDHNNIRTLDLAGTIAFYEGVVGLTAGAFPGTPGQGAWLYDDGGTPVLHIVPLDPPAGDQPASRGSGAIDHMAFGCTGYAAMRATIEDRGLPFRANEVPSVGLRQLFVSDPNGIMIELNFRE